MTKKTKLKDGSKKDTPTSLVKTLKTLELIALTFGCVEAKKETGDSLPLTTFDNMAIAQGHAAVVMQWAQSLESDSKNLTKSQKMKLSNIRFNLEDLMSHIHSAIQGLNRDSE